MTTFYYRDENARGASWTPPVDVFETDARDIVLKADLPDMTREDISVKVDGDTLTLSGERRFSAETGEDRYRRLERAYGQFTRTFTLPNTVDPSRVRAEYKNGVLTVVLPLRQESKPRTINVEVAA